MHLSNGFLDWKTATVTAGAAAVSLGFAAGQVRRTVTPRSAALMGAAAAFVFASQMVNFPVSGGTSGHLVGGALTAVLLGLAPAMVVMAAVIIVQCFLFGDGGVTALGANLLNMAVIAPCVGAGVFHGLRLRVGRGVAATALAAWLSTVAAAGACAVELAVSGTVPLATALPAMLNVHALIGIGEAAVSAAVLRALTVPGANPAVEWRSAFRVSIPWALAVSLVVALFVSPFACGWPDGLETVAERFGFIGRAWSDIGIALPDYSVPGLGTGGLSTAAAGAIGTVAVFMLVLGGARLAAASLGRRS